MTVTDLTPTNGSEALVRREIDPDKVELIKRTIAKGASNDERALFIAQCNRTGLDPFARQIYCVGRYDGKMRREVFQTQVSIDGVVSSPSGAGSTPARPHGVDGRRHSLARGVAGRRATQGSQGRRLPPGVHGAHVGRRHLEGIRPDLPQGQQGTHLAHVAEDGRVDARQVRRDARSAQGVPLRSCRVSIPQKRWPRPTSSAPHPLRRRGGDLHEEQTVRRPPDADGIVDAEVIEPDPEAEEAMHELAEIIRSVEPEGEREKLTSHLRGRFGPSAEMTLEVIREATKVAAGWPDTAKSNEAEAPQEGAPF